MKHETEKRMVCFIAAAVLLILTLWLHPAVRPLPRQELKESHATMSRYTPRKLKKLAMPVGVSEVHHYRGGLWRAVA